MGSRSGEKWEGAAGGGTSDFTDLDREVNNGSVCLWYKCEMVSGLHLHRTFQHPHGT